MFRRPRLKILFLLLSLLPAAAGYSQSPLPTEDPELQHPADRLLAFFDPTPRKPVHTYTYIVEQDTFTRRQYDRAGNEVLMYDYASNRPSYRHEHAYRNGRKTATKRFIRDILQSIDSFWYDPHGNLTLWKETNYRYDKSTGKSTAAPGRRWTLDWNDRQRLKRRSLVLPQGGGQASEYTYNDAGHLKEIDELQRKTVYEYEGSLPVRKSKVYKSTNTVADSAIYTYNSKGQLTVLTDNYNTIQYRYADGLLSGMSVRKQRDTLLQEADFSYKDGLLTAVAVRYNDLKMVYATPILIMKADYLAVAWKRGQINTVDLQLSYDQHRNVTEIRYMVNGVYRYSKRFLYTYY